MTRHCMSRPPPCARRAAGLAAALAVTALAGCGVLSGPSANSTASAGPGGQAARATPVADPSPAPAAQAPPCPSAPAGFSCTMRRRIAAAERYLKDRPGMIGIVLRDRSTGAVWRNRYAGSQIYMASTSKLAMAVTLLLQNQAGVIHLSGADRAVMDRMLHVSSDNAADDLWFKYGATFYTSYFPRIGLTGAHYLHQAGVTGAYWGEMTCTAEDESRLINYVLDRLPAALRDYLVYQLRHVAPVQHFGVWGAGLAGQPGNKNGWSVEKPGWIIDSTGFAGPGERYTLAMMNSLDGAGGYQAGTETVTQVAAILFRGHRIAAPHLSATP
ncbi:MAG TPA: tat pathway signal sequence [Streptosporangiaceae bacterium]|nr:tat pathway signal sequence [Streptosporangiaceae bacterium]